MSDVIELDEFIVPCTLGVLEKEQRTVQTLAISLRMELDLEGAAGGDLTQSVDYAAIRDQVRFLAQHGRFRLLETLAFGIARLVLSPPAPGEARVGIDGVRVHLRKPDILDDAVPGITISRVSTWCEVETRMLQDKVWAERLASTPRSAAHRVTVQPGATWSVPPVCAVMVLAGRGTAHGRRLASGDVFGPSQITELVAQDVELVVLSVGALDR